MTDVLFGLEFEANYSEYDEDVQRLARKLGMEVKTDGSVRITDPCDSEPCEREFEPCDCGDDNCDGGVYYHPCTGDDWCDCYRSDDDSGAEIVTRGAVEWSVLLQQYETLREGLGQQDESAGVHTHVSIKCDCGYDGAPDMVLFESGEFGEFRSEMARLTEGLEDREYVNVCVWDGVLRPRYDGYRPVVKSNDWPTTEIRWLHSILSPDQYVEAMQFQLRHFICPDCAAPVGNEEIFGADWQRAVTAWESFVREHEVATDAWQAWDRADFSNEATPLPPMPRPDPDLTLTKKVKAWR
jgi:hypothetical protein